MNFTQLLNEEIYGNAATLYRDESEKCSNSILIKILNGMTEMKIGMMINTLD